MATEPVTTAAAIAITAASKTFKFVPKITKTGGIFKKDCLHKMVFEVFRQFFCLALDWVGFWFCPSLRFLEAQCYAGATVFEVFSDGLVMFGDQFEVFS